MHETEWLQNLKPGDEVAIANSRSWSRYVRFARVERLTASQIIVSGKRFRQRDGREVGGSWSDDRLEPATDELKEEIARERRHNELHARVRDVKWSALSDETLERIVAILDEPKAAD